MGNLCAFDDEGLRSAFIPASFGSHTVYGTSTVLVELLESVPGPHNSEYGKNLGYQIFFFKAKTR